MTHAQTNKQRCARLNRLKRLNSSCLCVQMLHSTENKTQTNNHSIVWGAWCALAKSQHSTQDPTMHAHFELRILSPSVLRDRKHMLKETRAPWTQSQLAVFSQKVMNWMHQEIIVILFVCMGAFVNHTIWEQLCTCLQACDDGFRLQAFLLRLAESLGHQCACVFLHLMFLSEVLQCPGMFVDLWSCVHWNHHCVTKLFPNPSLSQTNQCSQNFNFRSCKIEGCQPFQTALLHSPFKWAWSGVPHHWIVATLRFEIRKNRGAMIYYNTSMSQG